MSYSILDFCSGHCVRGSIAFLGGILCAVLTYWNKPLTWLFLLAHHVLVMIPAPPFPPSSNVLYLRHGISEIVVVPFSFLRMSDTRPMTSTLYESLKNDTRPALRQMFNTSTTSTNDFPCPFRRGTVNGMHATQLWIPGPCDFFYQMTTPGSSVPLQLKAYAVAFVLFTTLAFGVMVITKWLRGILQRPYKEYIYLSPRASILTLSGSSGGDYATVDD
ncbi:hypothetical protein AAVH_15390 [Aphelenchoides avenae]|nr:hypothetical protein AAVH_15390 [Aphelenchus avenae]